MNKKFLILPFLIGASLLSAQTTIQTVSPASFFGMQNEASAHAEKVSNKPDPSKDAAVATSTRMGKSEVMIINPETRAKDLQESFQYLKRMSPASKLAVKLNSGTLIADILDMQLMTGGTMIIFRINSIQGQKFQVVKIEDIDTLTNA